MNKTKIYFICPRSKKPIGGIKQIYRQVDILNENGFNAVILHKKTKYRCTWFKNNTKVESNFSLFNKIEFYLDKKKKSKIKKTFKLLALKYNSLLSKKIESDSIIVFPEVMATIINLIEPDLKKVIYNQNCYLTFHGSHQHISTNQNPYITQNTIATIVVSEDSKEYIKFAFPNINLYRLRLGINDNFSYRSSKKKQVAFMPRKAEDDINQVISLLKQRNTLKNWEFIAIDNKSEIEVATIMKESYIYLSFSQTEGFGLPPAEAMACGCIVIGYTGRGGKEYFKDDLTYEISDRDIIGFTSKIEEIANSFNLNESAFIKKGEKASEYILNEYNLENEKNDIISIWNDIFKKRLVN
jgi:glycosyltransferase involved in cell wall biosynthesis